MNVLSVLKALDTVVFEVTDRVLVTGILRMDEEMFLVVLVFEMNLLDVVGQDIPPVKCTVLVNDVVTEQFDISDDKETLDVINWLQESYNKFRADKLDKAKRLLSQF